MRVISFVRKTMTRWIFYIVSLQHIKPCNIQQTVILYYKFTFNAVYAN